MEEASGPVQKLLTVITAVVEASCTSCIICGWAAMDYILTQEGYFSSDCNITTTPNLDTDVCPSQAYNLELVYTLSAVLSNIFVLFGGMMMDRFGTMVFRNFSTLLFISSCVAIAFSSPAISWILYPAMIILSSSGLFLYVTAAQTANLFPKFRGTIVNFMNGAQGVSSLVFAIAKSAYEADIGLKIFFLFVAIVIGAFLFLRTYFLMPKRIIPYDVPEVFSYGFAEFKKARNSLTENETVEQTPLLNPNAADDNDIAKDNETFDDDKSGTNTCRELKSSIFNSLFILGMFSLGIQWFRCSFFAEALNSWLKYMIPHSPHLVSFDVSFFGYIQVSALVFNPLSGLIYDAANYHFGKNGNLSVTQAKLRALMIVCLLANFCSISLSIFSLIDSPKLQYASFALFVIASCVPEANLSLLLIQFFPMDQFGTLYGLVSVFIGLATAMQFPFFYIAIHYFNGNFLVVNIIALFVTVLILAHPCNLYRLSKKKNDEYS